VTRVYPMTNVEQSPVSYLMDPKEQFAVMKAMRQEGLALVGIYHSHTASRPYPSRKDLDMAFYPEAVYLILSLADQGQPEVRGFRIVDRTVTEVPLEIADGPAPMPGGGKEACVQRNPSGTPSEQGRG